MAEENSNILQKQEKCDIVLNRKAMSVLNHILSNGHTAEVYIGKYGLVIREVRWKVKYDQAPK